jgi:TolB protein
MCCLLPRHPSLFAVLLALVLWGGCDTTIAPPAQPDVQRVDRFPAWSPDGSRIAYLHDAGPTPDTTDVTGLYVLDLEADSTWLAVEGLAASPDWRPDGERIAFAAGDIFTIRSDGSDLQRVTTFGSSFHPRWSPDAKTLTFGRSGTTEVVGVWFAHLPDSTFSRFGWIASPADWAAHGKRIVYQDEDQIWTADTTWVDATQLTNNNLIANPYPAWSPDGDWIVWAPDSEIWVMRSDGSEQQKLVDRGREPAWSPNSERIVFSRPAQERDLTALWTIRRDGSELRQITTPSRNPLN